MAESGDKVKVTKRQSVDSKKIQVPLEPLEPKCQVGGIRVVLNWDCEKSI